MAAPDYVPVLPQDRPRRPEQLPAPRRWTPSRPGDFALAGAVRPAGERLGSPGPDQGFALVLARQFEPRLVRTPGEHRDDIVAGCAAVAMRRAALFGRAPVIHDLELAFTIFGLLGDAPGDLAAHRGRVLEGVAHDYAARRHAVDTVPEATLRLSPDEARGRMADWRTLLGA